MPKNLFDDFEDPSELDLEQEGTGEFDGDLFNDFAPPEQLESVQSEQEGPVEFEGDPNFITGEAGEGYSLPTRVAGEVVQEGREVLPEFVQNIPSSFAEGLSEIPELFGRFTEHVGKRTGIETVEETGKSLQESMESTQELLQAEGPGGFDVTDPQFYTGTIPRVYGSVAPFLAIGIGSSVLYGGGQLANLGGALTSSLIESAVNTGGILQQADQKGLDQSQKNAIANSAFAKNALLNTALSFGEIGLARGNIPGVNKLEKNVISKFLDGDISSTAFKLSRAGLRTAGESAQEFTQEALQGTVSASELAGEEQTWGEFFTEGGLGAIGAAPFGFVSGISGTQTSRSAESDPLLESMDQENVDKWEREFEEVRDTVEQVQQEAENEGQSSFELSGVQLDIRNEPERNAQILAQNNLIQSDEQFAQDLADSIKDVQLQARMETASRAKSAIEGMDTKSRLGLGDVEADLPESVDEQAELITQNKTAREIQERQQFYETIDSTLEETDLDTSEAIEKAKEAYDRAAELSGAAPTEEAIQTGERPGADIETEQPPRQQTQPPEETPFQTEEPETTPETTEPGGAPEPERLATDFVLSDVSMGEAIAEMNNMIDRGEMTREQKDRAVESMNNVQQYSHEKTEMAKNTKHLLDYFDEQALQENRGEGDTASPAVAFDLINMKGMNNAYSEGKVDNIIADVISAARAIGLDIHRVGGDEFVIPIHNLETDGQKLLNFINTFVREFQESVEAQREDRPDLFTQVYGIGENIDVALARMYDAKDKSPQIEEQGLSAIIEVSGYFRNNENDDIQQAVSDQTDNGHGPTDEFTRTVAERRIESRNIEIDGGPQPPPEGGSGGTPQRPGSPGSPAPETGPQQQPDQRDEPDRLDQLESASDNSSPLDETDTGNEADVRTDSFSPEAHYAVVSADELITSFDEGFPQNALQGRTAARQQFRQQIRSEFDPERLAESDQAEDGAPVVSGADSFVESGNLRVDILRNLYDEQTSQAQQYRNYLIENAEELGLDQETINELDEPILVRVRESGSLSPEQRIEYTREANEQTDVAERNVVDRARRDADRIGADQLTNFDTDYAIDAQQNQPFVRSFIESLPANQQDAMLDSDNNLTTDGRRRILFALSATAFEDLNTLQAFIQREGEGFKRIFEPLGEYAADFAQIKQRVRSGEINERLDLTGDLTTAINRLMGLKDSDGYSEYQPREDSEKSKVAQYLESPQRMFEGDDFTEDLMKLLERFGGANGSKKRMRFFLDQYVNQVLETAQSTERGLPGVGSPTARVPFSPAEILRKAARETEVEFGLDRASLPMFKKAIRREMQRWVIDKFEPTDDGAENFVNTIREALEIEENGPNGINSDGDPAAREVDIKRITNGLSSQHLREFHRIEQKDAQEPLTKWFAQQVTDFDVMPDENIDENLKVVVNTVLQGESDAEFTEQGAKRFKFLTENSKLITTGWHKDALGELIPALEAEGITDTPSILQAVKLMMMQGGSQRSSDNARNLNRFVSDRIDFSPMLNRLEEKEASNPELEGTTDRARETLENWERLYGQKIEKRMRSGMSIQEIFRGTQNVDMTLEDFMNLAEGSVLNAEEMVLLGAHMLHLESRVQELAERAHRGGEPESTFQELQELRKDRNAIREAWAATKSEWGRTGRAQQVVLNEQIAQQKRIKDKIVAGMTPEELTESEQEALHERAKENLLDKIEEGEFGELTQELWEDFAELIDERKLTDREVMKEFYNKHGKFNWKDFGTWLWHANIFSSLATNERNLLGNFFNLLVRIPSDFTRVGIDAVESQVTGKERERFLDSVGREARAVVSAWGRAAQKAKNAFLWGRSVNDGANFDYLTREPPLPETFKRVYGWDLRFMHMLDAFFRTLNAEMTLNRMASDLSRQPPENLEELARRTSSDDVYTELLTNPTDEMLEAAQQAAQGGVFQDQLNNKWNPFRALEQLQRNLEDTTIGYPFSFMLRFMRTTSNLFSKGFKFLGGGYLTGAYNEYQAIQEADLEQKTDYREMSRQDLALAMVGSASHLLLAPLALAGNMTGGGPEDDDLYKEWLNQGWRPYSIMVDIGDERYSISYRYWAPFNMQMALLADTAEQFRYNDQLPTSEKIQRSAANLGTFFSEQSLLYGITNFVDWVRGRPSRRNPFVSIMSGFGIPWVSLLNDFRGAIDPVLRDPETWYEEVANQIPGLSQRVEPIRNKYGQAVTRESPLGVLQPFTIPFIGQVDEDFETYQENSLLENRIEENMQRLRDGFELEGIENQRIRNWIKAEHIVSKLNQTDDKDEASKRLMQFREQGLLDEEVNEWLTWVIRAEESQATKAQYGDYLYDDDRELLWYSGDYLASKIERRLSASDRRDSWKRKKWNAIKEFLRIHKYNDLSREAQTRRLNKLYNTVFELAAQRDNPLFQTRSPDRNEPEDPLTPAP